MTTEKCDPIIDPEAFAYNAIVLTLNNLSGCEAQQRVLKMVNMRFPPAKSLKSEVQSAAEKGFSGT